MRRPPPARPAAATTPAATLPWHRALRRGLRVALELGSAPLRLRAATHVGLGSRTRGRPLVDNGGVLQLGARVILHSHVAPVALSVAPGAELVVGDGTFINYGTRIRARARVSLGRRVLVGTYVTVTDDPEDLFGPELGAYAGATGPVRIADDVWLGAKCIVFPGVCIGRGAIVGAGAHVVEDVPEFAVVGGQPARLLRRLDPEKFVGTG